MIIFVTRCPFIKHKNSTEPEPTQWVSNSLIKIRSQFSLPLKKVGNHSQRQGGERGNQSPCVQSPTSHPPAAPLNSRSNNFRISNATVIGTVTCDAGINTWLRFSNSNFFFYCDSVCGQCFGIAAPTLLLNASQDSASEMRCCSLD